MEKCISIVGQRFGRLVVVERRENNKRGGSQWLCRCDCGTTVIVAGSHLRSGHSKSCGCLQKDIYVRGQRFGRLTIIEQAGSDKQGRAKWKCLCSCDQNKIVIVRGGCLRSGSTQSCGCMRREKASKRLTQMAGERHPRWKGGRKLHSAGYVEVLCHDHPRANPNGYVLEHILVMEQMLGRPLVNGETVHHCDGNPANNGVFNLRLFPSNGEHVAFHNRQRCVVVKDGH